MSYTDIFNQGGNSGLSMGSPTVNTGAVVDNAGSTAPSGFAIQPPSVGGVGSVGTPQVQGPGGDVAGGAKPGFFSQYGPAQFALGAIQTLGSLWNSFQQNKMAKQSFEFQKQAYETNLRDTRKNYNTALEDRIEARYNTEGRSQAEADKTIAERRL